MAQPQGIFHNIKTSQKHWIVFRVHEIKTFVFCFPGSQTFVRNRLEDSVRHDVGPHSVDREPASEGKVFRQVEDGATALRQHDLQYRLLGELQQKHPQLRLGQFPARYSRHVVSFNQLST